MQESRSCTRMYCIMLRLLWRSITCTALLQFPQNRQWFSRGERLRLFRMVEGYTFLTLWSNEKRVFCIYAENWPLLNQPLRTRFMTWGYLAIRGRIQRTPSDRTLKATFERPKRFRLFIRCVAYTSNCVPVVEQFKILELLSGVKIGQSQIFDKMRI